MAHVRRGLFVALVLPFWVGMAVTIMAGLTFGTMLTMIVVPAFYCIFYKVKSPV